MPQQPTTAIATAAKGAKAGLRLVVGVAASAATARDFTGHCLQSGRSGRSKAPTSQQGNLGGWIYVRLSAAATVAAPVLVFVAAVAVGIAVVAAALVVVLSYLAVATDEKKRLPALYSSSVAVAVFAYWRCSWRAWVSPCRLFLAVAVSVACFPSAFFLQRDG